MIVKEMRKISLASQKILKKLKNEPEQAKLQLLMDYSKKAPQVMSQTFKATKRPDQKKEVINHFYDVRYSAL